MKKTILLAGMMLAAVCAQAQLTVAATGYTTSSNMTITGKTGIGYTGVLTVAANSSNATHSLLSCGPKAIICAKSGLGAYPFLAYGNNSLQPVFYVDYNGYIYSQGDVTTSDSLCKTNITQLASPLLSLNNH